MQDELHEELRENTDEAAATDENAVTEENIDTEALFDRRHRALVDSITKRMRSAAVPAEDAFEAVGKDAFAFLDKIDSEEETDVEWEEEHSDNRPKTRKRSRFVPPVDAGAHSHSAGNHGGLFDSIQADASELVTPDSIRSSLKLRMTDAPGGEQQEEEKPEPPNEDEIRAKALRRSIRKDRYIDVARSDDELQIDKSSFPVFRSAMGLELYEEVIPEVEDVPEIMRTRADAALAEAAEAEEEEQETLPDLFSGIGKQYAASDSRPWEMFEPPAEEAPEPDPEEEIDSGELLDMIARCELEHERRTADLADAARRSQTKIYDPYNTAFNSRTATRAQLESIPSIQVSSGYVISTEHHTPSDRSENGSPKRRRQRGSKR